MRDERMEMINGTTGFILIFSRPFEDFVKSTVACTDLS